VSRGEQRKKKKQGAIKHTEAPSQPEILAARAHAGNLRGDVSFLTKPRWEPKVSTANLELVSGWARPLKSQERQRSY